jgi:NAD+ diphosphatase
MDTLMLAQRNAFVSHAVARAHERRLDEAWLSERRSDPRTRFVVVWHDRVLLDPDAFPHLRQLTASEVEALQARCSSADGETVLLGHLGDVTYFGVGLDDTCTPLGDEDQPAMQFLDLRSAAALLDSEEGALAAQAKAMVHWHRQQRFCGRCGSPTRSEEGGYTRRCTQEACGQVHFPRVDPAIIVLVTYGTRCLLGRQASWPQGRYSNIAGFVEPGESLETAVAREVWEETGIEIKGLSYHSSQPWPFPQSLMVGFLAEAATTEIRCNDGELEDARWFTRETIRDGLLRGELGLPSPYSISFHLIEDWFDQGDCGKLGEVLRGA